MSTTGKMTKDDELMFGTKYINRALAAAGLQLKRGAGNKFRGVQLSEAYKAYTFSQDNTRLVQLIVEPT